jgi:hypothetical protein
MGRHSMKEEALGTLMIPPAGAVLGVVGFVMGMRGSIAGVFVLAAVIILLLVFLPKLVRGVRGRYGRGVAIRSLFAAMTLVSLTITALAGSAWVPIVLDPPRLVPKSREGVCATRIEYLFPGKKRVIHDPYRKVVFCWGASPPEVRKDPDGAVVAVFRGDGGHLSTWWDQAGVTESDFDIGGWMGATISEDEMEVTEEGEFNFVDRLSGKPVVGEVERLPRDGEC